MKEMTRWGRFACNTMGWHIPPRNRWTAGINTKGLCERCGKEVMQDSQGNWF